MPSAPRGRHAPGRWGRPAGRDSPAPGKRFPGVRRHGLGIPRHHSRRARRPRPDSSRGRAARCINHKGLDGVASAVDQAARRKRGRPDRRAKVRNRGGSKSPKGMPSRNRPSSPNAGRAARAGRRRGRAPWRRSRAPATRGCAASSGPAHEVRRRPAPATRRRLGQRAPPRLPSRRIVPQLCPSAKRRHRIFGTGMKPAPQRQSVARPGSLGSAASFVMAEALAIRQRAAVNLPLVRARLCRDSWLPRRAAIPGGSMGKLTQSYVHGASDRAADRRHDRRASRSHGSAVAPTARR